jgi:hypothetical protein
MVLLRLMAKGSARDSKAHAIGNATTQRAEIPVALLHVGLMRTDGAIGRCQSEHRLARFHRHGHEAAVVFDAVNLVVGGTARRG